MVTRCLIAPPFQNIQNPESNPIAGWFRGGTKSAITKHSKQRCADVQEKKSKSLEIRRNTEECTDRKRRAPAAIHAEDSPASDSKYKAHSVGVDLAELFQNSFLFIFNFSFRCELLLLLDYLESSEGV